MGRPRKHPLPLQQVEADSESLRLARRIWAGQSVSLTRRERLLRIASALAEHGLSMDGVDEGLPK